MYDEKPKRGSFELADIGTRFFAAIIDGIILGVITGILTSIAREPGFGAGFLISLAYEWYFLTRRAGQTPGKSVMKIRVVKTDGTPIDDATAIVRYVGRYISGIIVIGLLWALWDEQRQGWHDKVASTVVVRAE
jgi:uncharacterized RDD family membrane protein YckC